ncbi:MAG TPA: glycosyltransferase family 2 protein [Polyangiaceae bacterium]|nr:glycosyltransferase family 2 protein [Polyangiaceae bacterium]
MPCLNEADTIEVCVSKALRAIEAAGIDAEVVIADNGSSDGSQALAEKLGARVVNVPAKGYGSALMGGIAAARGRYVIMGDADDSYDFLEIPKFVQELRKGFDVVQGCRLPSGGGTVLPGAMPFLHRWWGNPMFSIMARTMFRAPIHDIYCGMRGFSKAAYLSLDQRCTGMEFATEMIIKASRFGLKIGEVPITLHPDGRKAHAPHLKTFRDGWRTLRFFLMCSPRWLFLWPGVASFLIGLIGYALAMPGAAIGPATLDAHTLLVASLALLVGQQGILFAVFAKMFSLNEGLLPQDPRVDRFFKFFTLEKGLALGVVAALIGVGLLAFAFAQWQQVSFGRLDYAATMRLVIPAVTLIALGIQAVLGSFMISIMSINRT